MEIYSTEEQQVEAIKSFWSKYGIAIVGGVVVGLASIYGWNYSQEKSLETQGEYSNAYTKAIESTETDTIAAFVAENTESGYSTLAALQLAKLYVEANNYEDAKKQLQTVIAQDKDVAIVDLASLRLARILVAQTLYDEALVIVEKPQTEAYTAQFSELLGDIKLVQGDSNAARSAYQTAMDNSNTASNPGLKMKLDNLAVDNGIVTVSP